MLKWRGASVTSHRFLSFIQTQGTLAPAHCQPFRALSRDHCLVILFSGNSSGRQWGNKEQWTHSTFWCWENLSPGENSSLGVRWGGVRGRRKKQIVQPATGLEEITLDLGRDWQIFITQAPHECFLLPPTQTIFLKVDLLICFVHLQGVYLANWPHPSKGSTITRKIYEANWTNKATSHSHLPRRRTSHWVPPFKLNTLTGDVSLWGHLYIACVHTWDDLGNL